MAQIETWYNQDLKQPVKVHYLHGNVFSQDNQGNIVGVEVFDDGVPASLSGSVSASIIRSDGATVAASGTLSGNKLSVALPAAAYAVPGVISIVLKLTTGSVIVTLLSVVATVYASSTDAVVDPGTIIPSVEELIQAIETAVASIPPDYSELWESLAPNFSTGKDYKADQYVTYNGGVYRFKVYHEAGTWNRDHVKKVDIANGISEIKGALDGSGIWSVAVEHGNVLTADGREADNNQRLRTGFIDVSDVDYINIILEAGYRMSILFYDADGIYVGGNNDWGDIQSATRWYDVSDRELIRCVIINKNPPSESWVMPYETAQNNYILIAKKTNNFIASTGEHYIEKDSSGIYFRWEGYIWLRGSLLYNLPSAVNSGLTLTESPLGVADCVYIAQNKTLAVDLRTLEYSVIDTETLKENSAIVPLINDITVMDYRSFSGGLLNDAIIDTELIFAKANAIISMTYQKEPYFEYAGTTGVYFNPNGIIYIRGYSNSSYLVDGRNWNGSAGIPIDSSISLVTSPMGKTDCLFVPHNYSAIYVPINNKVYIVGIDDLWKYPYSLLLFQVIANGGHDVITNGIGNRNIKYINDSEGINVDNGNVFYNYNSSFGDVGENVETFMFFSDPHVMERENTFNAGSMTDFVNALRFGYENTPTSFIVDGGDWLNSRDYIAVACYKLGLIDGIMRKNFPNYFPINGNHDTNNLGYVSESDLSSGELSVDTMVALHYRENADHMYYSFDGTITKNYVFDGGDNLDNSTMTAYRWEQVAWFANRLLADDPAYGIVWNHIIFTDYTTFDPTKISGFMQIVGQVVSAFNSRSSVTLNGQTYNFTGKTGRIWCFMCGHTHYDMQGTLANIPVVSVINAIHDSIVSYDLGYFDFDNEVLKLFRIGSGSNRTINL